MTVAEKIYEQVKELPEPLAREVLSFIDRLLSLQTKAEARDFINAQTASLAPVWDNAEDEVWNNV